MALYDREVEADLMAWIDDLRRRLERGDLAGHPPVDIGDGTGDIPAELTIKIMLAALDSYDDLTPAEAKKPVNVAQWFDLLDDFRFLRILMGGGLQQAPAERMGRGAGDANEGGQPPGYRDLVGEPVRVRLPRNPPCEDRSHTPIEDGHAGVLVHCAARPGGPSHP